MQLAFGEVKPKRVSKAHPGHLEKNNLPPMRVLREFRIKNVEEIKAGDVLNASVFEAGEHVDVIGISKGKGFAGAVALLWQAGPCTHGTDRMRAPGSSSATTTPAGLQRQARARAGWVMRV